MEVDEGIMNVDNREEERRTSEQSDKCRIIRIMIRVVSRTRRTRNTATAATRTRVYDSGSADSGTHKVHTKGPSRGYYTPRYRQMHLVDDVSLLVWQILSYFHEIVSVTSWVVNNRPHP